jgi:hypothetical protein
MSPPKRLPTELIDLIGSSSAIELAAILTMSIKNLPLKKKLKLIFEYQEQLNSRIGQIHRSTQGAIRNPAMDDQYKALFIEASEKATFLEWLKNATVDDAYNKIQDRKATSSKATSSKATSVRSTSSKATSASPPKQVIDYLGNYFD